MGVAVAELYAKFGLMPDRAAWARGDARIRGMKGKLGQLTKLAAGVFGGFAVKRAVGDAFDFESALDDLDVAAKGAAGTVDEMRDKMLRVSDATGVTKDQILQGTQAFVELTGEGAEANRAMETFGQAAVATRADMGDIANVAGRLKVNMGVTAAEFDKAFSIFIAGGKEGSVEFRNLAGVLGGLAPQFAKFEGGSGLGGVASLGAALQIGAQGFDSASEAATGLQGMMVALIKNTRKFEKAGVQVYGENGQLRNLQDIVNDLSGKDLSQTKLKELFGRVEGMKFFNALTRVNGAWDDFIARTQDANDLSEDFATKQQRDTQKVRRFWIRIKNEITRTLSVVIDWLGDTVDWLDEMGVSTQHILTVLKVLFAFIAANALRMAASWAIAFGPLGLVVAGVAAITAAIADLFSTADGREGFLADLLGPDTAGALKLMLEDARDALVDLWDKAREFKAWVTNDQVETDFRATALAAAQENAAAEGRALTQEERAAILGEQGEQAVARRVLRGMGVDSETLKALRGMTSFDMNARIRRDLNDTDFSAGTTGLGPVNMIGLLRRLDKEQRLVVDLKLDRDGNLARAIKQAVLPVIEEHVASEVRKL